MLLCYRKISTVRYFYTSHFQTVVYGRIVRHKSPYHVGLLVPAGVTWFEVNLESKKVVVKGDVTPFEVLQSVSKVKFAQLWMAGPQRT